MDDRALSGLAEEFNRHENRTDGSRVAGDLATELTLLRDVLYVRVHDDVHLIVGEDSMLMSISPEKSERKAKLEIELYQIIVSAAAAREHGHVLTDDWYIDWLARLRLGRIHANEKVKKRLAYYRSKTRKDRRLAFTNVLASVLPESRRAPLILFRLLPRSVEIATVLAFGDDRTASAIRRRQIVYLPAIGDCRQCQGQLLKQGEQCAECGNPLWEYDCLTSAD